MTSNSNHPPTLGEYLTGHGFMPAVEDTWFDRTTGNGIIRVVYQT